MVMLTAPPCFSQPLDLRLTSPAVFLGFFEKSLFFDSRGGPLRVSSNGSKAGSFGGTVPDRDLPYFVTCRRPDSWRESHRRRAAVARILAGSGYVRLRSSCLPPALFPFRPSRGGGAGNVAVSPCRPCPEPPRHAFPHPRSPRAGVLPEQEPRRFRIARARALSTTSQRAVGGGMCLAVGAAGAAAYGMGVALCAEQPDELVDMSQLQQWDSNWDGRCPPTRGRARQRPTINPHDKTKSTNLRSWVHLDSQPFLQILSR